MKFFLYCIALIINCSNAQNSTFYIQGECEACPNQKVYISQMSENGEIIDTVNLVSGKFTFQKRILNEEWFQIRFQNKKGVLDLIALPGQHIEITSGATESIDNSSIKGSPESIDRMNYIRNQKKLGGAKKDIKDSIAFYKEKGVLVPIPLLNKQDSIDASMETMVFETILKTKSILLKDLSLTWIKSPIYIRQIKMHIDSLATFYQNNHDFKNLQEAYFYYLDSKVNLEKLDIENFFMNFSIQSLDGIPITPKNINNKYLFVEFWTSWCKPCRESNQKINQNRAVFLHDKLFPFFISLDKDPLKWKKAINEDNLEWAYHGIDAYDLEKSFAKSIGINFIPTNLLVAPNGQIILQNATPEDVKAFLDKLK